MAKPARRTPAARLTARERQLLDVVYQLERANAREVHERLEDPPSWTTVRGLMRILERPGHVWHVEVGRTLVYRPTVPKGVARRRPLKSVKAGRSRRRTGVSAGNTQARMFAVAAAIELANRTAG
ncbi:MAG: BlaI/MecI/CopY family transcriptional regulator [Myxococcales bacterium]|nr:BlaI/MecI/CopY family transcriptional regulator [Myxococcales bacterium]